MKRMLTLILVAISFSAFSQGVLKYTEVIHVEGATKAELYNRAKSWFATTCVDAKEVIQVDTGDKIIGRVTEPYTQSFLTGKDQTTGEISYLIKIYIKEGRYKYVLSNFSHKSLNLTGISFSAGLITTDIEYPYKGGGRKWRTRVWQDIKLQIKRMQKPLIKDLKSTMERPDEEENDNW